MGAVDDDGRRCRPGDDKAWLTEEKETTTCFTVEEAEKKKVKAAVGVGRETEKHTTLTVRRPCNVHTLKRVRPDEIAERKIKVL